MTIKQFRVLGHTILNDGRTFDPESRAYVNGPGPVRCSCGAESSMLPSTYARREWGRAHKKEMVASGAEVVPSTPSYYPMTNEITKRCAMSAKVAPETRDPGFDKHHVHVTCPECHRSLYIRGETRLYPTHYIRVSPKRADEVAKTRLNPIPGLYVLGVGSSNHFHRRGKHQVWKLTYRDRAYLIWRVGKDYMWTVSSYNPFAETYLAVTDELEKARGIVVDWGEGGSIYEKVQ